MRDITDDDLKGITSTSEDQSCPLGPGPEANR